MKTADTPPFLFLETDDEPTQNRRSADDGFVRYPHDEPVIRKPRI